MHESFLIKKSIDLGKMVDLSRHLSSHDSFKAATSFEFKKTIRSRVERPFTKSAAKKVRTNLRGLSTFQIITIPYIITWQIPHKVDYDKVKDWNEFFQSTVNLSIYNNNCWCDNKQTKNNYIKIFQDSLLED
jgi:hypothetical protein